MSSSKSVNTLLSMFVFLTSTMASGTEYPQPIQDSRQMLLVVTDDDSVQAGTLYQFQCEKESDNWLLIGEKTPVVVGRNGLAWGCEDNPKTELKIPQKAEGDGKSPAGVFTLGACFGFAKETEMEGLKIPYLDITDMTECIDDKNSQYYNKIIERDKVNGIDWNSSEKMRQIDPQYTIGVIVNYNTESPKSGRGSCIFLHIWKAPSEPTSGCTAMAEKHMREIAFWLDEKKNPILVQLTIPLYNSLKASWNLPEIRLAKK